MISMLPFSFFSCLIFALVANANRCSNPSVRREWSSISETERVEWINAVKCLSTIPHDDSLFASVDPTISLIPAINTSAFYYDDFTYVHMDLNTKIHFTGLFLPWHRGYVHAFESALKDKCGYTGTQPYWNWSLDAENFFNSSIWNASPTSGFGGNGDPDNDYQVSNGSFSADFLRAYPVPHHVRRNFTLEAWRWLFSPFGDGEQDPALNPDLDANTTFDPFEVNKAVTGFEGDFEGFQAYVEGFQGMHSAVHAIIAADMLGTCPSTAGSSCIGGAKWTPNDPIFFMHHSMIDKVWYDWQHENPANFWSYFGGSVQALETVADYNQYPNGAPPFLNFNSSVPSDGMYEEYSIFDMMNTTSGPLCYVYA